MGGARESSTSERRLAAIDKQRLALELRKAGVPFTKIAQQLDYEGPSGAYGAVKSALKRTLQEPAAEVRALELDRLDHMLMAHWPAVIKGHIRATELALKIMERRAAYLGLDAPKDALLTVAGHVTREYILRPINPPADPLPEDTIDGLALEGCES